MTTEDDPCLRVCVLSECLTWCLSCGRTTDQIQQWYEMTDEEKLEAQEKALERKKVKSSPDPVRTCNPRGG